jgi:hypothetical protein
VVEADQSLAGAIIIGTLALEIVKAVGVQRRANRDQKLRLDLNNLNSQVVSRGKLMVEPVFG